jgi:hypothetical protein
LENVRLFLKKNDVAGTKWAHFAGDVLLLKVSCGASGRSEFGAFQPERQRIVVESGRVVP